MKETTEMSSVDARKDRSLRSDQTVQLGSAPLRMMELEVENLRLQRLVAELLMKNQQLRRGREA